MQLHFLPVAVSYDGARAAPSSTGHSFQLHVGYTRSPSRGAVTPTAPLPPAPAAGGAPPPLTPGKAPPLTPRGVGAADKENLQWA